MAERREVPLEWTPELYERGGEWGLWCIVRWAVRGDDLYLCGPLEMLYDLPADTYRGVGSLGFASRGSGQGGFLALFRGPVEGVGIPETITRFLDQNPGDVGRTGPGICQNHPLPLSALRFDVRTEGMGKPHVWGENLRYFEALTMLARAKLFERGHKQKRSILELSESIERRWTLEELRSALHMASLGSGQMLIGHRAAEANAAEGEVTDGS